MSEQIKSFSLNTIIEKPTPVLQPNVKPQQKKASKVESVINWDDIIAEWSYRLPKGFPTMKNGKFTVKSELKVLQEVLTENGINEMPDFTKKAPAPLQEEDEVKISAADLAKLLGNADADFSQETLDRISNLLKRKGQSERIIREKVIEYLKGDAKHADAVIDKMYAGETDQVKLAAYLSDRSVSYDTFLNKIASIKGTFQEPTGLSDQAFEELVVYKWQDTPVLGIVEVMLAMLLKDGYRPTGAGDLLIEGKGPFEVGGVNKRLRGQRGFGTAKGFREGLFKGYSDLALKLNVTKVSLSGGAKEKEGVVIPTEISRYGNSQTTGWPTVIEEVNKQFIALGADPEPIELATAIGTAFAGLFENTESSDYQWIAKYINKDGSLQRDAFYKELVAYSFDYYHRQGGEEGTGTTNFILANKDNMLIIPATGADLVNFYGNLKIVLPSFTDGSGLQGVVVGLTLK